MIWYQFSRWGIDPHLGVGGWSIAYIIKWTLVTQRMQTYKYKITYLALEGAPEKEDT